MLPAWHISDARIEMWTAADGWSLRTAVWAGTGARGSIVFMNGRGDFIEKYAETCRYWMAQGYSVLTWDWRGQGLSGRMLGEPLRTHLASFDPLVKDATDLLNSPFMAGLPKPWFLVGHSMGGHLAARLLHDSSGLFAKSVLLSPLFGLNAGVIPPRLVEKLIRLVVAFGQGRRFALGQTPYGAVTRSRFRQTRLTSDIARFGQEAAAIDSHPALASGGVTFGWVLAAMQSIGILTAPDHFESVHLPILLMLAGRDQVVDSLAAETCLGAHSNVQIKWIEGAAHELLRERDSLRDQVLTNIHEFLDPVHF
jgi:lysophospholipase